MITATGWRDRRVAVFGLAATGVSAVRALQAGGARVAAWDDSPASRDKARARGIDLSDLRELDFSSLGALVLSPGVPLTHPAPHWTVERATAAGVPVIGDTELFVRSLAASGCRARMVAVTGTNGKSTTTALIGHLLARAGCDAQVGGNIGLPVLDLDPPTEDTVYVVEFSSYQIDLTPGLHPDVAILLNLSPDHLDRHGDMAHYAAVKERIFAALTAGDTAIVGVDDALSAGIGERIPWGPAVVRISGYGNPGEVSVENGTVFAEEAGRRLAVAGLGGIDTLRGMHNWQNAAAAIAAVRAIGLVPAQIAAAIASFPGLPHRMEEVGRRGRVIFINDSKATNADAAARALASFAAIRWIAGGRPKADGIVSLRPYFNRIMRAYLIGEAAEAFQRTLEGAVDCVNCGTLERAVTAAAADAARGGDGEQAILLAPACASFDQFANFEARGDAFRSLVAGIEGVITKREGAKTCS